jgi:hypothetical protein
LKERRTKFRIYRCHPVDEKFIMLWYHKIIISGSDYAMEPDGSMNGRDNNNKDGNDNREGKPRVEVFVPFTKWEDRDRDQENRGPYSSGRGNMAGGNRDGGYMGGGNRDGGYMGGGNRGGEDMDGGYMGGRNMRGGNMGGGNMDGGDMPGRNMDGGNRGPGNMDERDSGSRNMGWRNIRGRSRNMDDHTDRPKYTGS